MRPVSPMKTEYQKNMLLGLGITTLLCFILSISLLTLPAPTESLSIRPIHTPVVDACIFDRLKTVPDDNPERLSVALDLTIEVAAKYIHIDHGHNVCSLKELLRWHLQSKTSSQRVRGWSTSSDRMLYSPEPRGPGIGGRGGLYAEPISIESKILVDYPEPALRAGIEGETVVLVWVEATGRLGSFTVEGADGVATQVPYYVEHESPSGWDFATSVLEVIPSWYFSPKIENGRKVGGFLRIRHRFRIINSRPSVQSDLNERGKTSISTIRFYR